MSMVHMPEVSKKVSPQLKECQNCKDPFSPSRDWQRFCSEKCRNDYHNTKRDESKNGTKKR